MLINLSDVFRTRDKIEVVEADCEMTEFRNGAGVYKIVSKKLSPFTFTNVEIDKAKINGEIDFIFQALCDRCAEEIPVNIKVNVERFVLSPRITTEDDQMESPFMDGYQIDMEALIFHEILENWPMKILCKEDCKGVCPVCGQNLNVRECGCDRFIPDPRMMAIADILERNKEV